MFTRQSILQRRDNLDPANNVAFLEHLKRLAEDDSVYNRLGDLTLQNLHTLEVLLGPAFNDAVTAFNEAVVANLDKPALQPTLSDIIEQARDWLSHTGSLVVFEVLHDPELNSWLQSMFPTERDNAVIGSFRRDGVFRKVVKLILQRVMLKFALFDIERELTLQGYWAPEMGRATYRLSHPMTAAENETRDLVKQAETDTSLPHELCALSIYLCGYEVLSLHLPIYAPSHDADSDPAMVRVNRIDLQSAIQVVFDQVIKDRRLKRTILQRRIRDNMVVGAITLEQYESVFPEIDSFNVRYLTDALMDLIVKDRPTMAIRSSFAAAIPKTMGVYVDSVRKPTLRTYLSIVEHYFVTHHIVGKPFNRDLIAESFQEVDLGGPEAKTVQSHTSLDSWINQVLVHKAMQDVV